MARLQTCSFGWTAADTCIQWIPIFLLRHFLLNVIDMAPALRSETTDCVRYWYIFLYPHISSLIWHWSFRQARVNWNKEHTRRLKFAVTVNCSACEDRSVLPSLFEEQDIELQLRWEQVNLQGELSSLMQANEELKRECEWHLTLWGAWSKDVTGNITSIFLQTWKCKLLFVR